MPTLCSVPGCNSNNHNAPEYTTCFLFPKEAELRIEWLRAIRTPDLRISAHTNVCIKHFAEEHIKKGVYFFINGTNTFLPNKKWTLKPGTIPTIFPDEPSYLTTKPTKIREDPEVRRKLKMDKSSALKLKSKIKIREFEKNLIFQVKKNKCMYDKNHPLYTNKVNREEVWRVISFILRKSVHECQNKWLNLRDTFRAYFRAASKDQSLGVISSVKWIHYESLKFLIPHIKVVEDDNLIYDENIEKQKAATEKFSNEDLSDHSYTISQNVGNSSSEEKNENDDHDEVRHEFDKDDDLIIMDPLLLIPEVSQSSDNCTNTPKVKSNKGILEPPPKRICLASKTKQDSFKARIENKILVTKLKIMERECYLKDLEILKIENELDVKPSKYTEHFYTTIDS